MVVRLELPSHLRVHKVFHVSLLEPHHISEIPGRHPCPPPAIRISTGEEYEVDQILDSRLFYRQLQYLVLCKGYLISEETWELKQHLKHASDVVRAFHERYPQKLVVGPKRRPYKEDNVIDKMSHVNVRG